MKKWQQALAALNGKDSYQAIFDVMRSHGSIVAGEFTDKNGTLIKRTYAEYADLAEFACGQFQKTQAFGKNDFVGLAYDTCLDWPVLLWGIIMAGGIPILLNPAAEESASLRILSEAKAKAYVAAKAFADSTFAYIPAEKMLEKGEKGQPDWANAIALCTSGTTGDSRIFLYDGKAICSQVDNTSEIIPMNPDICYDPEDGDLKLLAFLPYYHIFGFVVVHIWFGTLGKTVVYLRDRNPQTIMQTCRDHKVTHLFCVPMFFNSVTAGIQRKLAKQGEKKQKQFEKLCDMSLRLQSGMKKSGRKIASSLFKSVQANLVGPTIRFMISGGGHILPETLKTLNAIGYPLYNGFGMTESGITSVELSLDPKVRLDGSVGLPFSSIEYRTTENGELQIRGDSLHSAKVVGGEIIPRDKNEWFSTGDIARLENGKLYIEGRIKDVIINESGENIYPDEMEDNFVSLPGAKKSSVLGVRANGSAYEDVVLIIEIEGALDAEDAAALFGEISKINASLPMYKKLRRVLLTEKELPVSGSMKVQRGKLRQQIEDGSWPYIELDLKNGGLTGNEAAKALAKENAVENDPRFIALKDEVKQIFADTLTLEAEDIGDRDHFVFDLGGDSLSIIGVMAQIEEKYQLVIPDSEFTNAVNAYEITIMIYERLYDVQLRKRDDEQKKNNEVGRITDFKESDEYLALMKRFEDTITDEELNPYFVPHDSVIRDTSIVRGKEVINLGSYNYLGMSGHPETMQAAVDAVKKYGTSASGSRTLAGEKTLYQELERAISEWKHTEDAIVCTGGWATNLTFISCFAKAGDLVLYDALSHNSITEGVALSKADSKAFAHNDLAALENILRNIEGKYRKVLIVVEGVYSMDGDIAPIPEFVRLKKKYGCFLMVDEAHSGGVIGKNGGGVDDYFDLEPKDIDVKMGTLSKALGTCGGYIAADKSIVEYLRYSMNGFVFTAGISPALAAAAMKAIEIIRRDNTTVAALHRNIEYFVRRAKEEGLNTCLAKESAIVPVLIGSDEHAAMLSAFMLREGVFVPPAMYPAVPKGQSRLRFSITAAHSIEQLETAVSTLSRLMREYGFIDAE